MFGPMFMHRGHGCARHNKFRHFAGGIRRPKYNVPLNINEFDDRYEVSIYAAGFSKESIKVNIHDDVLTVTGKKELVKGSEPNFTHQEFPVKVFERTLMLNGKVDTQKITAACVDGVLLLTLPKTEQAKHSKAEIKVN